MRLVYTDEPDREVKVGDEVVLNDGEAVKVTGIIKPHKSSSTGRVHVESIEGGWSMGFFPSVIGAKWIEREDQ